MRLKNKEIAIIKDTFIEVFKSGEIYLFGSRVDDYKNGGDIDLYIRNISKVKIAENKINFLVNVKRVIGEQKIDLVIDRGTKRLIDKKAIETGVLLWKS